MTHLSLTILLIGCASQKAEPVSDLLPELKIKAALYQKLGEAELNEDGWILTDECDSLLHSALATLGGSVSHVNLLNARDRDGRWFRRPAMDCLATGSSKSSISRDMLLGLMLSSLVAKDVDSMVSLYKYAQKNNYVMGDHDGSVDGINRVLMTPSLFFLLKAIKESLEAELKLKDPDTLARLELNDYSFTDHLKLISIIIRGELNEEISALDLRAVRSMGRHDPNNALVWSVLGRYDPELGGAVDKAIDILMRPDLFPNDRLPTSRDRKTPYLWMHGENEADWSPSDSEKETHPGHDLTFAAWVILDE